MTFFYLSSDATLRTLALESTFVVPAGRVWKTAYIGISFIYPSFFYLFLHLGGSDKAIEELSASGDGVFEGESYGENQQVYLVYIGRLGVPRGFHVANHHHSDAPLQCLSTTHQPPHIWGDKWPGYQLGGPAPKHLPTTRDHPASFAIKGGGLEVSPVVSQIWCSIRTWAAHCSDWGVQARVWHNQVVAVLCIEVSKRYFPHSRCVKGWYREVRICDGTTKAKKKKKN